MSEEVIVKSEEVGELSNLRREVVELRRAVKVRDSIIEGLKKTRPRRCRDCGEFKSEGIFMICKLTYRRKSPDGYCDEACAREEKKDEA